LPQTRQHKRAEEKKKNNGESNEQGTIAPHFAAVGRLL